MRDAANESQPKACHKAVFMFLDSSMRLCVIPFNVASLWLMSTTKQVTGDYGEVEFRDFSGLKYFVGVNAICAGYALAALIISCLGWFSWVWVFFLFDQVVAYMLVTSGAVVAELVFLAHEGDGGVTWGEACSYFGKFCSKMIMALALHAVAMVCFILLSLISGYRAFHRFEPPSVPCRESAVMGG